MIKNKFYKNLVETINVIISLLLLYIPCIFGYIESLKYESNLGWILLVAPLILVILYFLIGFYRIFQKVIIDEYGVKIIFIKKIIKDFKWENINEIETRDLHKFVIIEINEGSVVFLDNRQSIIKAIKKYCPKEIYL